MTKKDFGNKITLHKILEEVVETEFIEKTTAYKRFRRVMEHLNIDIDELKYEDNIYFYEDEKDYIKGLIHEVGEPYLKKLINKKTIGKNLEDGYNEALKFTDRMMERINKMKHEELRIRATKSIEMLSRETSRELTIKTQEKVKEIGDFIINTKLYAAEYNGLLMEINDSLDKYYKYLQKRFKGRQF